MSNKCNCCSCSYLKGYPCLNEVEEPNTPCDDCTEMCNDKWWEADKCWEAAADEANGLF